MSPRATAAASVYGELPERAESGQVRYPTGRRHGEFRSRPRPPVEEHRRDAVAQRAWVCGWGVEGGGRSDAWRAAPMRRYGSPPNGMPRQRTGMLRSGANQADRCASRDTALRHGTLRRPRFRCPSCDPVCQCRIALRQRIGFDLHERFDTAICFDKAKPAHATANRIDQRFASRACVSTGFDHAQRAVASINDALRLETESENEFVREVLYKRFSTKILSISYKRINQLR